MLCSSLVARDKEERPLTATSLVLFSCVRVRSFWLEQRGLVDPDYYPRVDAAIRRKLEQDIGNSTASAASDSLGRDSDDTDDDANADVGFSANNSQFLTHVLSDENLFTRAIPKRLADLRGYQSPSSRIGLYYSQQTQGLHTETLAPLHAPAAKEKAAAAAVGGSSELGRTKSRPFPLDGEAKVGVDSNKSFCCCSFFPF